MIRQIAAVMVLLIFFAGISNNPKKASIKHQEVEDSTLEIESVNSKVSTLDSLLVEINKEYNGKKKR